MFFNGIGTRPFILLSPAYRKIALLNKVGS